MTEEIKKLIELRINAGVIDNRSNYALFNEGMRKGSEIAREIILSKWQEAERWRKVEEELPEVFGAGTSIPVLVKTKYGTYHVAVYSKPHDDFIEIPYSVAGVTEWKPIS